MAQPFVGEIIAFGGNFAPLAYMQCAGQILPIAEYDTLYALIGTTYGGNGTTTFGLPDLRGRLPIGQGQGPGLSTYIIGQAGGTENVTLTPQQMPIHNHSLLAATTPASSNTPSTSTYLAAQVNANTQSTAYLYAPYNAATQVSLAVQSVTPTGKTLPHTNIQPLQVINYCIALYGVFPSQG
jgi:microcystin-dependent protein